MSYIKTYIDPVELRRGFPVLVFAKKDGAHYYLGVYHDLIPFNELKKKNKILKHYKGEGSEYNAVFEQTINKDLYDALIKEAKTNFKRMEVQNAYTKKYFKKCRSCGFLKKINKPCVICATKKKK